MGDSKEAGVAWGRLLPSLRGTEELRAFATVPVSDVAIFAEGGDVDKEREAMERAGGLAWRIAPLRRRSAERRMEMPATLTTGVQLPLVHHLAFAATVQWMLVDDVTYGLLYLNQQSEKHPDSLLEHRRRMSMAGALESGQQRPQPLRARGGSQQHRTGSYSEERKN